MKEPQIHKAISDLVTCFEQLRKLAGDDVMRTKETASFLKLPQKSIYAYARLGKIPCTKVGKHYLFRRSALLAWMSERERDCLK